MHCVIWTFPAFEGLTPERAEELFAQSVFRYFGVPGLIRSHFGIAEGGRELIAIQLWKAKEDADSFYGPDWLAGIIERWGVVPSRADWPLAVSIEGATREVLRAHPPRTLRSVGPEDEDRRVNPGEGGANDD